jgi:hypothetical protein
MNSATKVHEDKRDKILNNIQQKEIEEEL